ncbi:DNA primase [Candidatus Peregrinibacteria bacterium]|nr:DNA primase [Candidatus Peregrinibacteria bacterium]
MVWALPLQNLMLDPVEQIRGRLSIEDVVGSYVSLKKSGSHFKALCPFHNEKTPSFVVSPDKGIAYCFGCHKGGDIFTFVQEMERVDFKEAFTILADRAGISLEFQGRGESHKSKDEKDRLYQAMNEASNFFVQSLRGTEGGAKVLEYLFQRGLTDDTIAKYHLGFAPDTKNALLSHLLPKGFTHKEMAEVGLIRALDTTTEHYRDFFFRRLMFPVHDIRGRIVAFGGRALSPDDEPKYLNSPETPIYHKSKTIYGLFHAKDIIKQEKRAVFVEGYMDVLALHQAGTLSAIASSGTAVTSEQLKEIKRFTDTVIFCFDSDSAGKMATERGIEIAQSADFIIKILRIPTAKDPADLIKAEGVSSWEKLLAEPEPYLEFVFRTAFSEADIETEEGRRSVLSRVLPVISKISNLTEKDRRIQELATRLGTQPNIVYESLAEFSKEKKWKKVFSEIPRSESSTNVFSTPSPYDYFFGLLFEHPALIGIVKEMLSEAHFPSSHQSLYKSFIEYYNNGARFERDGFLALLPQNYREILSVLALKVELQYAELKPEAREEEVRRVALWIRKKSLAEKRKKMVSSLREAVDDGQTQEKFEEYYQLLKEMSP